jgi:hypothetical protein
MAKLGGGRVKKSEPGLAPHKATDYLKQMRAKGSRAGGYEI